MTSKYGRGRAFEYRVKDMLEREGYFVIRSAGSHSVADLVAIKPSKFMPNAPDVALVQCFLRTKAKDEIVNLLTTCSKLKVIPCVAFNRRGTLVTVFGEEAIKNMLLKK
jgi:Holliday junction resolvase